MSPTHPEADICEILSLNPDGTPTRGDKRNPDESLQDWLYRHIIDIKLHPESDHKLQAINQMEVYLRQSDGDLQHRFDECLKNSPQHLPWTLAKHWQIDFNTVQDFLKGASSSVRKTISGLKPYSWSKAKAALDAARDARLTARKGQRGVSRGTKWCRHDILTAVRQIKVKEHGRYSKSLLLKFPPGKREDRREDTKQDKRNNHAASSRNAHSCQKPD